MNDKDPTNQPKYILSKERQTTFWSLIRSTPISLLGTLVLLCLIYPSLDNYIFIIAYLATFGFNIILKIVFKYIYDYFGTDTLPYIGQGTRPPGAHSCKSFIFTPQSPESSYNNETLGVALESKLYSTVPLVPTISFGMPSGHSQLGWFFAVYGCTILFNTKMNMYLKLASAICLIAIATIISYSRVYIEECHTHRQVAVGGIIGVLTAIATYIVKQVILFIL